MADFVFRGLGNGENLTFLSISGTFKPGDPPPSGYHDRFEWAKVQHKAGLRQTRCPACGKWSYPQELQPETGGCLKCAKENE